MSFDIQQKQKQKQEVLDLLDSIDSCIESCRVNILEDCLTITNESSRARFMKSFRDTMVTTYPNTVSLTPDKLQECMGDGRREWLVYQNEGGGGRRLFLCFTTTLEQKRVAFLVDEQQEIYVLPSGLRAHKNLFTGTLLEGFLVSTPHGQVKYIIKEVLTLNRKSTYGYDAITRQQLVTCVQPCIETPLFDVCRFKKFRVPTQWSEFSREIQRNSTTKARISIVFTSVPDPISSPLSSFHWTGNIKDFQTLGQDLVIGGVASSSVAAAAAMTMTTTTTKA